MNKYQTYIYNSQPENYKYSKWDRDKCCEYWQKEIGGEQRKCPAWLIYAWNEGGENAAWAKQDANRKIKREYDEPHLDWWFTENYNSGRGVGSSWAVVRGRRAPGSLVPVESWIGNRLCQFSIVEAMGGGDP